MILAPATRDLLERLMLTGPVRITASETDALQSLRMLGLAEEVARRGSFCATARGTMACDHPGNPALGTGWTEGEAIAAALVRLAEGL